MSIVSQLNIGLVGQQYLMLNVNSTPQNILGNPLPNGRHMIVLVDGNLGKYIGSIELLTVLTVPARIGPGANFYMRTNDGTEWNWNYEGTIITLTHISDLFYIASTPSMTNLVIQEMLIPLQYSGISNIYAIDNLTTNNPSPTAGITIKKRIYMEYTGANALNFGQGSVTQVTNINTSVTINRPSGNITTVSLNTNADTTDTFTVNNTCVSSTSSIMLTISNYTGTTLPPRLWVSDILDGSFKINISNTNTTSLDGVLKISFLVC